MILGIPWTTVVVWLVVGALAGTAAGSVLRHSRRGYGLILNTLIGLVGAIIGGFLFDLLQIRIGSLASISVNLEQLLAAFLGALLLVGILRLIRRRG